MKCKPTRIEILETALDIFPPYIRNEFHNYDIILRNIRISIHDEVHIKLNEINTN